MRRNKEPAWHRCARHSNVYFRDFERARLHFERICPDYWCHRCQKAFGSSTARGQHIENSVVHSTCDRAGCSFDGKTMLELQNHWDSSKHRELCNGCEKYIRQIDVKSHFEDNHCCTKCHRHFGSDNERKMHEITHLPAIHKCYGKGCDRKFQTRSGMFIHLESGTCPSTITAKDVNAVFALHPNSIAMLGSSLVKTLAFRNREEVSGELFKCDGTGCHNVFSNLSGILQHCESDACNNLFGDTKEQILPFLRRNLYLESAIVKIESLRPKIQKQSRIDVYSTDEQVQSRMASFMHRFYGICDELRQCLNDVHTSRFENCLETSLISYNQRAYLSGPSKELSKLEARVKRLHEDYTAEWAKPLNHNPTLIIWFQATQKCQTLEQFLSEVEIVLRILKLEIP